MYKRRRAARACSAPAPCSGPGASTTENPQRRPAPIANMQQATLNLFADMGVQPRDDAGRTSRPRPRRPTPPRRRRRSRAPPTRRRRHAGRRSPAPRPTRRRRRRRRRGLDRRRRHLAPGDRDDELVLHAGSRTATPSTTLKVRAVDDSGNLQTPGAGMTVNVELPLLDLGPEHGPPAADATRATRRSAEVGVKFKRRQVRHGHRRCASTRRRPTPARTSAACGPRPGTQLAQATFTGETASGWQTVTFSSPVAIQPEHDLRRVLLRAGRPLLGQRPTTSSASRAGAQRRQHRRQPAAARAAQHRQLDDHDDQRRLRLQRDEHVPDQQLRRRQLLGRRASSRRRRAPGTVTNVTATVGRPDVGERHLDGARRAAAP